MNYHSLESESYLSAMRMVLAARNLTNTGILLINGRHAPVASLVNMNVVTVDNTNIDDVHKGDEVVIIGKQNGEEISVNSFGGMINTLKLRGTGQNTRRPGKNSCIVSTFCHYVPKTKCAEALA